MNRRITQQSLLMTASPVAEEKMRSFSRGPADLHGRLLNPAAHCWLGKAPSARHSTSFYQKHSTHCPSSSSSFSTPLLQPLQQHLKLLEMRRNVIFVHNNKMCDVLLSNRKRAHSLVMFSKIYFKKRTK